MTWPVLPASTVVAHVLGTTVVLDQGSGVLASVDSVGAFVLDHRDRFADHRDARRSSWPRYSVVRSTTSRVIW